MWARVCPFCRYDYSAVDCRVCRRQVDRKALVCPYCHTSRAAQVLAVLQEEEEERQKSEAFWSKVRAVLKIIFFPIILPLKFIGWLLSFFGSFNDWLADTLGRKVHGDEGWEKLCEKEGRKPLPRKRKVKETEEM